MIFLGRTSREARIKRFIRRHFGVRVHSLAPYEEALRHSWLAADLARGTTTPRGGT